MTWEKKVQIYRQEEIQHSFKADEVFVALKKALTNKEYLENDKIHFFSNEYLTLSPLILNELLTNAEHINNIATIDGLCDYLKPILQVNELGVFIEGLFPFIENSVTRIGFIIEQLFEKDFEIPGSNLNLDLFIGDYTKTIQGIHRDGANISFVYGNKSFSFWDFETIENEAKAYSERTNYRSAFASGSYFFPKEMQEALHAKYDDKAKTYDFVDGDVFYWPTTLWHLSHNQKKSLSFTLNIAFYKSDQLVIKDIVQHSLVELERKTNVINGNSFYPRNLLNDDLSRKEFIDEEFRRIKMQFDVIESIYKKKRSNVLNTHLGSFGIKSSHLQYTANTKPSDLTSTCFFKPLIFKIIYTIENNLVIQLYYFGKTIKLPHVKGLVDAIDKINASTEFSYPMLSKNSLEDKETPKIIIKLLQFLSGTPGVYFKGN